MNDYTEKISLNGTPDLEDLKTEEPSDGVPNGSAVQLSLESKEISEKLILDKIEKLNIENHELKTENGEFRTQISQLEKNCATFRTKMERSASQVESAKKELQSMVIKYATSEKEVLNLKKHYGETDRKCKELSKERDTLQAKIKELSGEKKQLLANVERQFLESATLRNDNELLKNKLAQAEVKIEQMQIQLAETNLQLKNAHEKLEKIECGLTRLRSQETNDGEECGDQLEDIDWIEQYLNYVETNDRLGREIDDYQSEQRVLNEKIENLNRKLLEADEKVADYQFKVELIESLKEELIKKQGAIEDLKAKFDQINTINRELISDIESSKTKEGELLEYTERLTAKMVSLQSENNSLVEKLKTCEEECSRYRNEHETISKNREELQAELDSIKADSQTEIETLRRTIDEKMAECLVFCNKVDELENDIKIMKRKHIANLKELNKEILGLRKKSTSFETKSQTTEVNSSTLSSRTNSYNSLSELGDEKRTTETGNNNNGTANHHSSHESTITSEQSSSSGEQLVSLNDIDKNVLIERILRLQRTLIKRNEKIDFLEEHNEQLTGEVRKKSKLLQYYILKEETGALSTESMDKNKAYISKRGGGIMSSLYNTSLTDDTMTLERSLEINNKLHAVLEDTLLKNMTLKENLNTLALEIDRITKQKPK